MLDYDYPSQISEEIVGSHYSFSDGFAVVKKDEMYGYIGINGELVTPMQYEYAGRFQHGYALAKLDSKWCVLKHRI